MKTHLLLLAGIILILFCTGQNSPQPEIAALSYHNVRAYSSQNPAYFISPERFEEHMNGLNQAGYRSVLPNQVEEVFYERKPIQDKSLMISFDDTRADHYLTVAPILEKYGYRGTFFIMTVSIGKPGYMTREQIKELADRGHAIGLHTWDHQDLRKILPDQWRIQIEKPKALLEEITGKKITALAYPFGLWNREVILQINQRGLRSAYQLGGKTDPVYPVFSLPRILVPGNWSGGKLLEELGRRN
jgi:peptidoglycan/xylan/chitin deacetylase (PgdA/CDA1 family)